MLLSKGYVTHSSLKLRKLYTKLIQDLKYTFGVHTIRILFYNTFDIRKVKVKKKKKCSEISVLDPIKQCCVIVIELIPQFNTILL